MGKIERRAVREGEMIKRHVIKREHDDGEELEEPIFWCGERVDCLSFYFVDAQHVALALEYGTAIRPCVNCLKQIRKAINKGIDK